MAPTFLTWWVLVQPHLHIKPSSGVGVWGGGTMAILCLGHRRSLIRPCYTNSFICHPLVEFLVFFNSPSLSKLSWTSTLLLLFLLLTFNHFPSALYFASSLITMLLFFNSSSSAFHSLNLFLIPLLPLLLLFFFLFLYFTSSSEIHPSLLCILLRLGLNGNEYQVMYHGKKNETQSQHRSWVASLEKRKILWEGLLEFNFLKKY